jgi:hypothetical protein
LIEEIKLREITPFYSQGYTQLFNDNHGYSPGSIFVFIGDVIKVRIIISLARITENRLHRCSSIKKQVHFFAGGAYCGVAGLAFLSKKRLYCLLLINSICTFKTIMIFSCKTDFMANDIYFLFEAEDLQMLIKKGAVTVKAFSKLKRGVIDRKSVAIMVVAAEGFDAANKSVGTIPGCPCPPCTAKTAGQY